MLELRWVAEAGSQAGVLALGLGYGAFHFYRALTVEDASSGRSNRPKKMRLVVNVRNIISNSSAVLH